MVGTRTEATGQTTLFSSQGDENEEQQDDIDFKMVTFSLGGKDYGVDIMKVKEIAKFESFTYVPNTQPFVRGVYNLRGDIISVIDMRVLFNVPAPERAQGEPEDGLILRLDGGLIGVVVDTIDRVVGIASETIQPPHPIFADVNIKYIDGVVEHEDRLYIILDVERILGEGSEEEAQTAEEPSAPAAPGRAGGDVSRPREAAASGTTEPSTAASAKPEQPAAPAGSPPREATVAQAVTAEAAEMVAQTLHTLTGFTMTEVNRDWVERRLGSWKTEHGGDTQITTQPQVEEFLAPFYSPYSGRLWEEDYLNALRRALPDEAGANVNVWNPGCGYGYESYSIASLLRSMYPQARLSVWAGDNDLLAVSSAPNLVLERNAIPHFYAPFTVEGNRGYSFSSEIKETILFEYSDVTHANAVPPCDLIVIRDVMSFLSERNQRRVVEMIEEKAKESTIIVPGANEDLLSFGSFVDVSEGPLRAFRVA
jgi:purine-binding chemotaxis protein CheW